MTIIKYIQEDITGDAPANTVLNYLMVDTKNGQYPGGIPTDLLQELNIELIDVKLIDKRHDKTYDNKRLVSALLSLT